MDDRVVLGMRGSRMASLLGKTVTALWIDGDEQQWLAFDTNKGRICYYADGD